MELTDDDKTVIKALVGEALCKEHKAKLEKIIFECLDEKRDYATHDDINHVKEDITRMEEGYDTMKNSVRYFIVGLVIFILGFIANYAKLSANSDYIKLEAVRVEKRMAEQTEKTEKEFAHMKLLIERIIE